MSWRRRTLGYALTMLAVTACAGGPPPEFNDSSGDPAKANAKLGLAYMERGEYDVAVAKLKKAIEINPDLAEAHHFLAEAYQHLGNVELADKHFKRAISLSGSNPALQNNYGIFLCRQGRYQEALRHFSRAFDDNSYTRQDESYENAGLCALRIPDTAKAERFFRHALKIDPRRTESLYQMALLEYNTGHYLQARAFLQRLYDLNYYSPEDLMLGVKVERKLGDRQAEDRYTARLKKQFPKSQETRSLTESEHP